MKKVIFSLLIFSTSFLSLFANEEEIVSEPKTEPKAAIESKNSAQAIAWTAFGIGLLIAVGIVVAITVSKEK